jgi:HlyD family secretion protein
VQLVEVSPRPLETLVANTRAGTVKAYRRSHLSFDQDGQVSELLIQEGQWMEVIVHFSRESGK